MCYKPRFLKSMLNDEQDVNVVSRKALNKQVAEPSSSSLYSSVS